MELYKKYRPNQLADVVGQVPATTVLCNKLKDKKKFPHAVLFNGPSGCGKTTMARCLRKELNCSKTDFMEMNASDFRGIDFIREIRSRMHLAPLGGSCRIYVLDEVHSLTKDAQNAFLKILEDTPNHVYFFLCTTNGQKLLETVRNRCTTIKVQKVQPNIILALLRKVAKKEGKEFIDEVLDSIVEVCDLSPRKALVLLDSILDVEGEENQLTSIQTLTGQEESIQLCRVLINPRSKWIDVLRVLEKIEADPESLRLLVLSYFSGVLLSSKSPNLHPRCYLIINAFESNFYDSGKAGLARACYEVITLK